VTAHLFSQREKRALFVGLDLETTGIDPSRAKVVQFASVAPPSPMLRLLPDLRALKQKAHEAYCRRYGLPVVLPPIVKHADLVLLATEKRDVMQGGAFVGSSALPDPLAGKIRAWPNPYARFVKRWRELAREIGYKGVE